MSSDQPHQDDALDAELRGVPVPEGMLDRLRHVAGPSDEELDRALRDVPVPTALVERLRRIAGRKPARVWLSRVALAASVLIGLWLGYAGAIVASIAMFSSPPPSPPEPSHVTQTPDLLPSPGLSEEKREIDRTFSGWAPRDDLAAFDPKQSAPEVRVEAPVRAASPWEETERLLTGDGANRMDPLLDANLTRWKDIPSSHVAFYDLPELRTAAVPARRGVEASRSPGYNIAVLTRWGIHPFVSPAADPRLQFSEVPLGTSPASYDLACRCAEDADLPPRDAIRTEDFLAAIDYEFPRPTGDAVAVQALGGPSPFRSDGRQLLQISVQAREVGGARRPAARLTFAVDISASTQWGGRLDMVRRALVRLVDRFSPDDRVSLVAFSEEAHVLVEDMPASERGLWLSAVQVLRPQKSTNLAAGLRAAYGLALQKNDAGTGGHRVVLLTDGLAELDRSAIWRIEQRLAEAGGGGVRLDVVDLSQEERPEEESSLARFAKAGGGRVHRAGNANEIHWVLVEVVTGLPQLVARDVRLKVVFNSKAVAAYRLVGHEARAFAGLRTAPLESDFHAGQQAVAFYEVFPAPNTEAEIARAEITWKDPQESRTCSAAAVFRRERFAPLWTQSPWQVQAAAIAAEAAESLRGLPEVLPLPPFVRPRTAASPLSHVMRVGRDLDTRARGHASLAEFLESLKRLEVVRPVKGGGRR